ncbi:ABC transporter ATP-binding protein [Peribacillus frigoritolerans]|uniref:ABC transporter ATP-binding protein n=1 Tax=Peribacillus frigoritolerans TaxID=450367 RepID=UPI00105A0365|nr:ABC transporter ATP-binding protein [Peribacillus frigoritolerans]TDL80534.1 ABC transporter ATP-binding protein [Peribacillus frigoritolerans]
MIEVAGVSKTFGSQTVLKNVNFKAEQGKIVGLLGPNGAGKTTFIRILNGVIKADSGMISILNHDPVKNGDEIRKISGIVTEGAGLYHQLSGEENLAFFADLYGVKDKARIRQLLRLFDLADHKDKPAGTYSTGMKKRLALAKALLHSPKFLFLDEPTNGLDPDGIKMVLAYLKKYNEETGTTMIICSHVLHQLEPVCDSFAFLENQTIVEQGTKAELEKKYLKEIKIKVNTNLKLQGKENMAFPYEKWGEGEMIFTLPGKEDIPFLLKKILENHHVYSAEIINNDLESIYFKVREKHNE